MRPAQAFPNSPRPWLLLGASALSVALVIIGSLGPWLYTEFGPERARNVILVPGTSTDGVFSLGFATIAAILLAWVAIRPANWVLAWGIVVMMALTSLVGFFDWVVFEPMELTMRSAQRPDVVRVEWGLQMVTVAAPAGMFCAVMLARTLMDGDY